MRTYLCLLALLPLATGCASKLELASCGGPAVPLNPGRWQPTPAQQEQMNRLVQEACR